MMMLRRNYEEREEMSFIWMKPSVYCVTKTLKTE